MSTTGALLGSLETTGLEGYEVSQGEPVNVSTTTVGGVPVSSVSVGSIFSGTSGTLIVVIIVAIIAYFALGRRKSVAS